MSSLAVIKRYKCRQSCLPLRFHSGGKETLPVVQYRNGLQNLYHTGSSTGGTGVTGQVTRLRCRHYSIRGVMQGVSWRPTWQLCPWQSLPWLLLSVDKTEQLGEIHVCTYIYIHVWSDKCWDEALWSSLPYIYTIWLWHQAPKFTLATAFGAKIRAEWRLVSSYWQRSLIAWCQRHTTYASDTESVMRLIVQIPFS